MPNQRAGGRRRGRYRGGMRTRLGRYGWIPDLPDLRDRLYKAPRKAGKLPPSMDLRAGCPAVYDQGDLGSCTSHAISAAS